MYSERECFLCGRNGSGDPLDKHHIFGGAFRKKSERYGLTVYLCHDRCHENGPEAAHRNAGTMRTLREYGQRKAMEENGWSVADFIREFGKNYLDGEEELRLALAEAGLREEDGGQLSWDAAQEEEPAAGRGQAESVTVVAIHPAVFAVPEEIELPF